MNSTLTCFTPSFTSAFPGPRALSRCSPPMSYSPARPASLSTVCLRLSSRVAVHLPRLQFVGPASFVPHPNQSSPTLRCLCPHPSWMSAAPSLRPLFTFCHTSPAVEGPPAQPCSISPDKSKTFTVGKPFLKGVWAIGCCLLLWKYLCLFKCGYSCLLSNDVPRGHAVVRRCFSLLMQFCS